MNTRIGLAVAISLASITLLACGSSGGDGVVGSGASASTAKPLLEACSGTFACVAPGSPPFQTTLKKQQAWCAAGDGDTTLEDDHSVHADAGMQHFAHSGTWTGDSLAFDVCDSHGSCTHCTLDDAPTSSAAAGGSCSGYTTCSSFGAGDCSNHAGCSLDSHAVWFDGQVDHYENTCRGSTPSCSTWTTESQCNRQDCIWK